MSDTVLSAAPFKGLVPYSEEDAPFFFGRDSEIEIITANLLASRLTLLYGPSGVGKSSVLRAGVESRLRQQTQRDLKAGRVPETCVVVFPGPAAGRTKAAGTWRGNPLAMIGERVYETLNSLPVRDGQVSFPDPVNQFAAFLEAWSRRCDTDLLIILDQFEEYFLYHGLEGVNADLPTQLPRALSRQDLRVNFLISIREDAVAKLDLFKGRIPNLFDNYLRIDYLDRKSAKEAIVRPLLHYNKLQGDGAPKVGIQPKLVKELLTELKAGKVILSGAGRGMVIGEKELSAELELIETPYLQLVMARLWNEERQENSSWLRLETLRRLGGSARIVRTHLDTVMASFSPDEQKIAASIFNFLVTPSGTKIAHSVEDLAAYSEVKELPLLAQLMKRLCQGEYRILRELAPLPGQSQVIRYEIFHDVLAAPILDWRVRFQAARKLAEEKAIADKELAEEKAKVSKDLEWMPWIVGFIADLLLCLPIGAWLAIRRLKKNSMPLSRRDVLAISSAWVLAWFLSDFAMFGIMSKADSIQHGSVLIVMFAYLLKSTCGPLTGRFVYHSLKKRRMSQPEDRYRLHVP